MKPSREKNVDARPTHKNNIVSREGGQAYKKGGASDGHKEFAEILDNLSNVNSSPADQRIDRAAYKEYVEQEYPMQGVSALGGDQSNKLK